MDFQSLRDCEPASIAVAIDGWSNVCNTFTAAKRQATDEIGGAMRSGAWRGESAVSAQARILQQEGQLNSGHTEANALKQILDQAKWLFWKVKAELDAAIAAVAKHPSLTLTDSGKVKLDPDGFKTSTGTVAMKVQIAQAQSDRRAWQFHINKALEVAKYIDGQVARALRHAAGVGTDGAAYFNGHAATPGSLSTTVPRLMSDVFQYVGADKDIQLLDLWFKKASGTEREKELLDKLGFLKKMEFTKLSQDSLDEATRRYGEENKVNGVGDAWRHAYWSASLSRKFGDDWATKYTTFHEGEGHHVVPGDKGKAQLNASVMDLHNNEVGRQIARDHPNASDDEIRTIIDQKIRNGELMISNKNDQVVPSNTYPVPPPTLEPSRVK